MPNYRLFIEHKDFVLKCQQKAQELEKEGKFNEDVNENPMENYITVDESFPFIRKGIKYNLKKLIYLMYIKIQTHKIAKYLNFKIKGKENLKGLKHKGAIITCNHISLFDSFAVRYAIENDIMFLAAEFNNWKGKMGDVSRHTGYLPVTNKIKCVRKLNEAIEFYLIKKHKKILIYPEQSAWRNYPKPRPMKNGAFHYAAKYKVPIIPLFITFRNSGIKNSGGEVLYYTINILKPIYPKPELSNQENVDYLRKTNFNQNEECYETSYGIPLKYSTIDKSKIII